MILFENENFLAVEKPPGLSLATPRGSEAELDAGELLKIGRRLFLIHRLDVGTSGVLLLAKTAEAHRRGSLLFQERRVEKTYRAIVWGHPVPARGRLDAPLAMDRADRRKMRTDPSGKAAETHYRTLRRLSAIAHLELEPRTGRTHQIRVHLSDRGHPIVGDDLYGGPRWRGVREPVLRQALERASRLFLHASRLELDEPFEGARLRIESPEPAAFAELLRAAGATDADLSR